mmetsp:Transcript_24291/g.36389  ORF Transcript_24291/g.36389 Transcript_24291/m.36389 type:complete len:80 (-) Transcript_24291:653-892(-)
MRRFVQESKIASTCSGLYVFSTILAAEIQVIITDLHSSCTLAVNATNPLGSQAARKRSMSAIQKDVSITAGNATSLHVM